jgi:hypothetical protein
MQDAKRREETDSDMENAKIRISETSSDVKREKLDKFARMGA